MGKIKNKIEEEESLSFKIKTPEVDNEVVKASWKKIENSILNKTKDSGKYISGQGQQLYTQPGAPGVESSSELPD